MPHVEYEKLEVRKIFGPIFLQIQELGLFLDHRRPLYLGFAFVVRVISFVHVTKPIPILVQGQAQTVVGESIEIERRSLFPEVTMGELFSQWGLIVRVRGSTNNNKKEVKKSERDLNATKIGFSGHECMRKVNHRHWGIRMPCVQTSREVLSYRCCRHARGQPRGRLSNVVVIVVRVTKQHTV